MQKIASHPSLRQIKLTNEYDEELILIITDANIVKFIEAMYPPGKQGNSKGYIELTNFFYKLYDTKKGELKK